jgi:hypothetical protein
LTVAGGRTDGPLSRVTRGKAKLIDDDRGGLGVVDLVSHTPFVPVRMFWICGATAGMARGGHAHKACSQFFICLRGRVNVDAMDGTVRREFLLKRGDFINIVPGIFATETFLDKDAILAVLCDRHYEPEDYIYERDLFIPIRT